MSNPRIHHLSDEELLERYRLYHLERRIGDGPWHGYGTMRLRPGQDAEAHRKRIANQENVEIRLTLICPKN